MRETGGASTPPARTDPETAAELLLLLRLVLADGDPDPAVPAILRRVALVRLGIDEDGVEEVVTEIEQLISAAGAGGVSAALRVLPESRRRELARLLVDIADGDPDLSPLCGRLASRVAALIGIEADRR